MDLASIRQALEPVAETGGDLLSRYGELGLLGVALAFVLPYAKRALDRVLDVHIRLVRTQDEQVRRIGENQVRQTEMIEAMRSTLEQLGAQNQHLSRTLDRLENFLERLDARDRRAG